MAPASATAAAPVTIAAPRSWAPSCWWVCCGRGRGRVPPRHVRGRASWIACTWPTKFSQSILVHEKVNAKVVRLAWIPHVPHESVALACQRGCSTRSVWPRVGEGEASPAQTKVHVRAVRGPARATLPTARPGLPRLTSARCQSRRSRPHRPRPGSSWPRRLGQCRGGQGCPGPLRNEIEGKVAASSSVARRAPEGAVGGGRARVEPQGAEETAERAPGITQAAE